MASPAGSNTLAAVNSTSPYDATEWPIWLLSTCAPPNVIGLLPPLALVPAGIIDRAAA